MSNLYYQARNSKIKEKFLIINRQLLPWVVAAKQIQVKSLSSNSMIEIDDKTNIKDVKTKLLDYEGIPVEQQALRAASTNWWKLGLSTNYSDPLPNDNNVKKIMSKHNTDVLALSLKLRDNSGK